MGLLILRAVSWPLAKSSSQQISNVICASFYQGRLAPWGRPGILPGAPRDSSSMAGNDLGPIRPKSDIA